MILYNQNFKLSTLIKQFIRYRFGAGEIGFVDETCAFKITHRQRYGSFKSFLYRHQQLQHLSHLTVKEFYNTKI